MKVDERAEAGAARWRAATLVVRSGFDDDALLPAARPAGDAGRRDARQRRRRRRAVVPRAALPDAAPARRMRAPESRSAAAPAEDGAAGVLAGTLAAAEALHALIAEPGAGSTTVKHLRLPLDGREPLRQEIPAR